MGSPERSMNRRLKREAYRSLRVGEWVFHGSECTYWTDKPSELLPLGDKPVCPRCLRPMLQIETKRWWDQIRRYAATNNTPDYERFMRWAKRKCAKHMGLLIQQWKTHKEEKGIT